MSSAGIHPSPANVTATEQDPFPTKAPRPRGKCGAPEGMRAAVPLIKDATCHTKLC